MPDERQLQEPREIVLRRYPALRNDLTEARFDECFANAFSALLSLQRTMDGTLNLKLDKSVLLDRAERLLHRQGASSISLPDASRKCRAWPSRGKAFVFLQQAASPGRGPFFPARARVAHPRVWSWLD
jgi:hypothetical protein